MQKKVTIGIQARSTSTRLPGKIFEKIGDREILEHVLDACDQSCIYLNRFSVKSQIRIGLFLLIPQNDAEIIKRYRSKVPIIEGDEYNVLDRFKRLHQQEKSDYYVRVTSDCPFIPPFLISKHVNVAIQGKYDYVSNVDLDTRTSIDGHDVEVISRTALEWLLENAKTAEDLEHVTLAIRKYNPSHLKTAHIIGHVDLSGTKLSVDTQEDLEGAREAYNAIQRKIHTAVVKSGPRSIHRV